MHYIVFNIKYAIKIKHYRNKLHIAKYCKYPYPGQKYKEGRNQVVEKTLMTGELRWGHWAGSELQQDQWFSGGSVPSTIINKRSIIRQLS